jgi:hypothetical protein
MTKLKSHAFYMPYRGHQWHEISILNQKYLKNPNLLIRWLGFTIKCPLQLNGWNDMGLTIHEWLVTYVFPNYNVIAKPSCKTQDVLLWKMFHECSVGSFLWMFWLKTQIWNMIWNFFWEFFKLILKSFYFQNFTRQSIE